MNNRDLPYRENTACCQIWCTVHLHSFPFLTIKKAPQIAIQFFQLFSYSLSDSLPINFYCANMQRIDCIFPVCLWNFQSSSSVQLKMHDYFLLSYYLFLNSLSSFHSWHLLSYTLQGCSISILWHNVLSAYIISRHLCPLQV